MRATGVAVVIVGMAIMTYCAIMWMFLAGNTGDSPGDAARNRAISSNFLIPLAISGGTITIGLALAIFGDKGFKFSGSTAERN